MVIAFHDRQQELASLRRAFDAGGAGLYILYGRRRLGKTTLLQRLAEEVRTVYHVADRMTESDAIRMMAGSMAIALDEPTLAAAEYPDWYALFATFDRVRPQVRMCLVLDEYQYLCEIQPAFSSMLQRWWDQHWSNQDLLVILCGSVLSMMHKETMTHSSPLYGRRTGQCLLEPLCWQDTRPFFSGVSAAESIRLWALTGGVPRYAELAAGCPDLETALRQLVLQKDAPLYAEASLLLQEEVKSPNVYWSLLRTIASGANRLSEIAGRMKMSATRLTPYLAALRDMRLVARLTPVTEPHPDKSKRGIYTLTDNFLRLWFQCIAPYESLLEMGRVDAVMERIQEPLGNHLAWTFEKVVREHLARHAADLGLFYVGRYWSKDCEFDAVGIDEDRKPLLVAEAKWSANPVGMDVVDGLQQKTQESWPQHRHSIRYALFAPGGFTEEVYGWADANNGLLVGLEDLAAEG